MYVSPANMSGEEMASRSRQVRMMLVVEDEEPCRRALRKLLEARGYEVHAVGSAEEALAVIVAENRRLSLMFVDVDLPGMCGLDLVEWVQNENPGIHPVLVTAADRTIVQRFCATHSVDYFPKPLDVKSFLQHITHVQ